MPKGLLFFLLPSLCWAGAAQAQATTSPTEPCQLLATYRLIYQPDSTSADKRAERMQLLIGRSLSQFESLGQFTLDTLRTSNAKRLATDAAVQQVGKQTLAASNSGFKYKVYKNAGSGRLYYDERILRETYRYEEPVAGQTWTISPATATIAGYKCQRATASFGGRQYEAWFTREVPVAEGPYKFAGLPGLIVKVGDIRQHYVFELLQLTKPQQPVTVMIPTESVTPTTKAKFLQAKRNYELTLPDKLAALGQQLSEADRQAYQQRLSKKNNPLELR